jgi:hypothetical protein
MLGNADFGEIAFAPVHDDSCSTRELNAATSRVQAPLFALEQHMERMDKASTAKGKQRHEQP